MDDLMRGSKLAEHGDLKYNLFGKCLYSTV